MPRQYIPMPRPSVADRFWSKVNKTDGCWEWTGYREPFGENIGCGYGKFRYNGIAERAHRVSWMLHFGDIPDGLWVLHSCDNPACVRPDHLFLGTQTENMRDMATKGRNVTGTPTHHLHGEYRGADNPFAKLTDDAIRDIRARRVAGHTYKAIGNLYGISDTHVMRIVRRLTWNHVE